MHFIYFLAENLLVAGETLKLADLGSCKGTKSPHPFTEYVSTRWYRSPECLLTDGLYSFKMDIWALGCVFFELITLNPLFPGKDELDQLHVIHDILGTPTEATIQKILPSHLGILPFEFIQGTGIVLTNGSQQLLDFLILCLAYDPYERLNAKQALHHPYFMERKRPETPKVFSNEKISRKFAPVYRKRRPLQLPSLLSSRQFDSMGIIRR